MIAALKIFNGSHDLTTPCLLSVGVICTLKLNIKFDVFAITNYEDA